jgi:hypothetical protein
VLFNIILVIGGYFVFTVGQTANYAVVVAQLHTKGVCHGIHPFIVQLRDEETHKPMPGMCSSEARLIYLNIQRGMCYLLRSHYM